MIVLPEIVGRGEFAALIVRTDYDDEAGWRAVVAEVSQACGTDGESEAFVHLVDDPAWAGAAPDAVRAAVSRDDHLSVVFVADAATMRSAHHALLALDLDYDVHANLSLANVDFDEFAEAALADPEGVVRPVWEGLMCPPWEGVLMGRHVGCSACGSPCLVHVEWGMHVSGQRSSVGTAVTTEGAFPWGVWSRGPTRSCRRCRCASRYGAGCGRRRCC
ncbi:DUF6924 domain-containing protein [Streptomyces adustus]